MGANALVLLTTLLASLHGEVGGQNMNNMSSTLTTTIEPIIPTTPLEPITPTSLELDFGSGFSSIFEPITTSSVVASTPTPVLSSSPASSPPPTTSPPSTTSTSSSTSSSTSTTDATSESAPTSGTTTTSTVPSPDLIGPVLGGVAGALLVVLLVILIIIMVLVILRSQRKRKVYISEAGRQMTSSTDPLLVNNKAFDETAMNDRVGSPLYRRPILIQDFPEHVKELHMDVDRGMEDEYQSLGNKLLSSYSVSKLPCNINKNRFENVFPYDASRVKLSQIEGVQGSDYINASFMDGYDKPDTYIAAQGPLHGAVGDFWRMVWEYKLPSIIMLTETVEAGKNKCEQYWPGEINEPWKVGYDLAVTLIEHRQFTEYKIKNLTVQDTNKPDAVPLKVTHFHFAAWPDHGVPADKTSLIHFIQRVRKSHAFEGPPLLVHCSAGVGRTGTFMVLDSMMQRMKAGEETLNVYEFICQLRLKRPLMVQTEIQYAFIHDALEEFITCGDTSIAVTNLWIVINKLRKVMEGKSGFLQQFKLLEKVSQMPTEVNCSEATEEFNASKNRYPDHIPYNLTRTRLRPTGVKGADYINASFIDGYKHRRAYIATQGPLESTVNDFWRMVWETKSRAIVMLCNLQEDDKESCFPYWPMEKDTTLTFGKLKVKLLSEKPCGDYVVRKLELGEDNPHYQVPGVPDGITITQFHHTKWPEKEQPSSSASVLKIIDALIKTQISTGNHAITIMCNDGVGRTGTFICIYSQLERIKVEGVADVFQYIKASRLQRPKLVSELEQFTFCHHVLADYIDSFDTYANFKDLV